MDVFELTAKIGLDKSEYEQGVASAKGSMSNLAQGVGNGLRTVAKIGGAAIAAGAAGVTALTKMGIEGYKQYEQLVGGVETLFKTSQDVVMGYAKNAYKTAGMSANEYMETVTSFSASLIQSLGGDTAKAAEVGNMAITDMSDNANKMGTSMEMIQNAYNGFAKQNYTMLDNLKLGYGGTQAEMQRLIDDANKVKEANGEMADLSIESFADVTEAIHIIQTEMGITGTTAREAATTIEGSLSMMKGAWENLVVGMADGNADMDVLIDDLVKSTTTAAGNLLPRIEQTLAGIGTMVAGLAPVIVDALPGLVSTVLPSLLNAAIGLVNSLISAVPGFVDMLATSLAPNLISGIVIAFEALVAMLPTLIESIVSALPTLIPLLVTGLVDMIVVLCTMMPQIIQPIIDYLPEIIFATTKALLTNLPALISGVGALIMGLVAALPSLLQAVWETITLFFAPLGAWFDTNVIQPVGKFFADLWQGIKDGVSSAWDWICSVFSVAGSWIYDNVIAPVAQFFTDLWNGITSGVQAAWNWCVGLCSTVASWIYSNVVAPVAQFFIDLWNGIVNAYHTVIDPWIEIFRRLSVIVEDEIVTPIKEFFVDLWNSIVSGLQTAWDWCVNLLSAVATWIYDNVIKPVADFFVELWSDTKEGANDLWNGIKNGATSAWKKIKEIFSVAAGWFDDTLIKPVANFFTRMWDGLKNGATSAWAGIKKVFSVVSDWFKDTFSKAWQKVKDVFSTGGKVFDGIKEGIVSTFKTVVNAIIGGINKVITVPFNAINTILAKIKEVEIVGVKPFDWVHTFNVPQIPQLSTGLHYVPYDEYPAFLHRGEAVLTAAQARAWRDGQLQPAMAGAGAGGITINQYIQTVPQTPVEFADATEAYFEQARWTL